MAMATTSFVANFRCLQKLRAATSLQKGCRADWVYFREPLGDTFDGRGGGGFAAALTDGGAAGAGGSLGPPSNGFQRRHLQEPDHMEHASVSLGGGGGCMLAIC